MLYIKGESLHKCLVKLPNEYNSDTGFPLVVGLHGGGHSPDNMIALWDQIPNIGFIFSVPQAPYPFLDDKELKFDWAMWPSRNSEQIIKATELSETYIVNVVKEMVERFNISDVYLMGWSQGAIFSYLVGIRQNRLFNGIICMSGPGLLAPLKNPYAGAIGPEWLKEEEIRSADKMRVFITHGKDDQAAGYDLGTRSGDVLESHGYEVTFRDFEGGHSYPPEELLREIADWII